MSSDHIYTIRDWPLHFETSESRKRIKALEWVATPTKHDGKGFRRTMRKDPSGALFGAFVLIVQVAAKCPVRGVLADGDGPLTARDISDKTGLSESAAQSALEFFSLPDIGWIEDSHKRVPSELTEQDTHYITLQAAGVPADAAGFPADLHNPLETTGNTSSAGAAADPSRSQQTLLATQQIIPVEMFDPMSSQAQADRLTFPTAPPLEFEEWWNFYPLKVGKVDARKEWEGAIIEIWKSTGKPESEAQSVLLKAAKEYAASPAGREGVGGRDSRPAPAKWLKTGKYLDDRSAWQTPNGNVAKTFQQKPKVLPLEKKMVK